MSQSSPGAAPVCPRHPDTVSYVRCQRCNQPVCPRCQVPGSVGVHCVDCVAQARSRRRTARTVLGGVPVKDTVVTKVLIAVCVVVYVLQVVSPQVTRDFAFLPVLAASEPWRFLSSAFLHATSRGIPLHLAFNMWALWVLGTALEPVLGRARFATLWIVSALGGSTMIYLLASTTSRDWFTYTVGASGAVFGLFAAMFIIQRRFGRDTSAITGLLVINLVISFLGANISWQGHLGGLLTGGALAAVYAWAPRAQRRRWSVLGPLGVLVVLVALIVLRGMLI